MTLAEQKTKLNIRISKQCNLQGFLQKQLWSFKTQNSPRCSKKLLSWTKLHIFLFFSCSIGKQDKIIVLKSLSASSVTTRVHTTPLPVMPLFKKHHTCCFQLLSLVQSEFTQVKKHTGSEGSPCSLQRHQYILPQGLSGGSQGNKTQQNNEVWFFIAEEVWLISAPIHLL